jgi:hypothetical protein
MTQLQRRLQKLEAGLPDSVGLVPHTQKWLEYPHHCKSGGIE